MTWKAQLVSLVKDKAGSNLLATFQYSDDTGQTFSQANIPSDSWTDASLAAWAQRFCILFENRDATFASVSTQPGPLVLPRDTPDGQADMAASTAAQAQIQAQMALTQKANTLNALQSLVAAGVITADDPSYAAASGDAATAAATLTAASTALQAVAPPKLSAQTAPSR